MKEKFIEGVLSHFNDTRQKILKERNSNLSKSLKNVMKNIQVLSKSQEDEDHSYLYHFSKTPNLSHINSGEEGSEDSHVYLYRHTGSPMLQHTKEAVSKYVIRLNHDEHSLFDISKPDADKFLSEKIDEFMETHPSFDYLSAIKRVLKQYGYAGFYNSASKHPQVIVLNSPVAVHSEIQRPKDFKDLDKWMEASH